MSKKIKIIGMCGTSGSGKGYVCRKLAALGIPSVDTDKVYRQLVDSENEPISECLAELKNEFGAEIINEKGCLDRQALRNTVFAPGAAEKLKRLNAISHKYILLETQRIICEIEKLGAKYVVVDAPVLFESGFDSICDIKLLVSAPVEICKERIIERDGISELDAHRRLVNQKSADELRRLCDFEIVNDGSTDISKQIGDFMKLLNEKDMT